MESTRAKKVFRNHVGKAAAAIALIVCCSCASTESMMQRMDPREVAKIEVNRFSRTQPPPPKEMNAYLLSAMVIFSIFLTRHDGN